MQGWLHDPAAKASMTLQRRLFSTPTGIFEPACIHHGMLQPTPQM